MESTSKQESHCWTMQDVACTNCRSRKVRCDRERPQCGSCARDKVECTYSSPTKRVNHVKVLAQGFDDIQNRLIHVQEEVRSLTKMFQASGMADHRFPLHLGIPQNEPPTYGAFGEDDYLAPADGHVVRDDSTLIEKYHGPWTLPALCCGFGTDLTSMFGSDGSHDKLSEMWRHALGDGQCRLDAEEERGRNAVGLPPRQFLTVVLDSFFSRNDHTTDIFVPSAFYNAIDQTYAEPSNPASEAWALCFNLVILLVIGAEEGSSTGRQDPFIQPLIRAAQVAASNHSIFLSPKLVNVQVLALVSLLSQQSYSETLGDALFAQACMLAKAMGLDRAASAVPSSPLSPEEVEERRRVFRSLYIRDHCSSIVRGTPTWLQNRHATPLSASEVPLVATQDTSLSEKTEAAWAELANLQSRLLHISFAREHHPPGSTQAQTALYKVTQSLEAWSHKYGVPASAIPATADDVSLHLAFLGTRIRALSVRRNTEGESIAAAQVLHDARLSCLLFLVACDGRRNKHLVAWLERLLGVRSARSATGPASTSGFNTPATQRSGSSSPPDAAAPPSSEATGSSKGIAPISSPKPIGVHRLVLVFPTMGPFILARNILGMGVLGGVRSASRTQPRGTNSQHETQPVEDDTSLLKAMQDIFLAAVAAADGGLDNRAVKLARVMQALVDLVTTLNHHAHPENVPASAVDNSGLNPLLEGDWAMLPHDANTVVRTFGTTVDMPDLNDPSPGSSWTNDQGSSAGYLSRTGSSSVSISATTMSEMSFDISQLMDRMATDTTRSMWGELDAAMATTSSEYQDDVAESPRTRKRARTSFGLGGTEESKYL